MEISKGTFKLKHTASGGGAGADLASPARTPEAEAADARGDEGSQNVAPCPDIAGGHPTGTNTLSGHALWLPWLPQRREHRPGTWANSQRSLRGSGRHDQGETMKVSRRRDGLGEEDRRERRTPTPRKEGWAWGPTNASPLAALGQPLLRIGPPHSAAS